MITCQEIGKKPLLFKRFFGVTVTEFDELHGNRISPSLEYRQALSERFRHDV
jgi:hypothetical protein